MEMKKRIFFFVSMMMGIAMLLIPPLQVGRTASPSQPDLVLLLVYRDFRKKKKPLLFPSIVWTGNKSPSATSGGNLSC